MMQFLFSERLLRKHITHHDPNVMGEMELWLRNLITFRLSLIKRTFNKVAEISPGCFVFEDSLQLSLLHTSIEALPLQYQSLDLLIHAFLLHYTNDLPGVMTQIYRSLKPDGLFVGVFFGGDSLIELRSCLLDAEIELYGGASPHISPMLSPQESGMLLQRAGFQLPVVDREKVTLFYPDLQTLLKDIQASGQTNPMFEKGRLTHTLLKHTEKLYKDKFSQDGKLCATLDVMVMSGWAYHPIQQQPLLPGQGKTSLIEVL